ncbi:MAG: putative TRAP-type C4-dicarboxylate transport system, fusion of small and large permease protein, partial [Rhodospirillales bacterium]|nr:putative TRAP-type C4-dicarboxylate transport system, fusion of small and large permease protein [Rhodospirillales bacterium]
MSVMQETQPLPALEADLLPVPPPRTELGRAADAIDRGIGNFTDIVAGCIVAVELVILAIAVFARYVMGAGLTWTEELASLLFLWLGMLGTVSALRRGEHMRLTIFLRHLSAERRAVVDLAAAGITLTFLASLLRPTLRLVIQDYLVLSPDLQIPASYGVASVLVAMVLMLVVLVLRVAREASSTGAFLVTLAITAALIFVATLGTPFLAGLGNLNLVLFFMLGLGTLIVIGVPIAFAFGSATLFYLAFATNVPLSVIVGRMQEGMSNVILLTIPLFVFLGLLIECTGMAKRMVDLLAALLGGVRGGLGYALLAAMYLVSGISGAKAADMAAVGPVLIPEMKRRGDMPEGDLVALLATSAAMAETIPPSLVLIIIGSVTGVSIAALFTGGLLPALIAMIALAVAVRLRSKPASGVARFDLRLVGRSFLSALPALILPFVIRAAVLEGVATATEVATIGVVYVLLASLLIYRQFPLRAIGRVLIQTASLSGAILLIIAVAGAMSWALTQSGFSRGLVDALTHLPGGAAAFLAVSVLAFIVLGSALEGIPAIVLFGPMLFPAARALGINDVHYAMVV